MSDESTTGVNE